MLTEIVARIAQPMPRFWRKLQKRTAAASAALATLTVTVASFTAFPPVVSTALGYASAFFGGIAALCSLAVDDPEALEADLARKATATAEAEAQREKSISPLE